MCLYPKLIYNPKYKPNKKNNWCPPVINDKRTALLPIGCGECSMCRKRKRREWLVRLSEDIKHNRNGKFVTLTFSDESLNKLRVKGRTAWESDNLTATKAVRMFLERWRKKYGKSLRHWLITELGTNNTERIHLHGIVWTNEIESLASLWKYGYVWRGKRKFGKIINYVSGRTAGYITKYITKIDIAHRGYRPIILCSPGIGRSYTNSIDYAMNKYNSNGTRDYYTLNNGKRIALPIYWRNKRYTDEEKEKLWCELLDKQVRYVCGNKIDVSENMNEWFKYINHYREHDINMGYGGYKAGWNKTQYVKGLDFLQSDNKYRWMIDDISDTDLIERNSTIMSYPEFVYNNYD